MNLFTNMVIEWICEKDEGSKFERIVWVSHDRKAMYVIDLNDDTFPFTRNYKDVEEAIEQYRAKVVSYKIESELLDREQLTEKNQKRSAEAWSIIEKLVKDEPLIFMPEYRGKMVQAVKKEFNVSIPTINKHLKRYWQAGKSKNGILLRYYRSGGKGKDRVAAPNSVKRGRARKITELYPEKIGRNVDNDLYKIFKIVLELYIHQEKMKLNTAYIRMLRVFFVREYIEVNGTPEPVLPDESELPLYNTFKYWIRKEQNKDPEQAAQAFYNERQFNLKVRAKTGSDTKSAPYPGSRYQIDATIGDIYMRSSYRPDLIIGKPVIYTVLDVCTHMFAGLYVGLEGPSYLGAMMAVLNTGSSKVEYCRKYGITITEEQWPCMYLPEQFTADRGELLSKNNVNITNGLGVDIEYAAPYRADWKPLVESYFNVLNKGVIHRLPGATSLKLRERGQRDSRLDATLTLQEFTSLIIGLILKHNNTKLMKNYPLNESMLENKVMPIPTQLWNWGIQRGGALRFVDEETLRKNLLPRETARVTKQGIKFKKINYTCPRAEKEGWFIQTNHPYMGKELAISYDPRNTSKIYIRNLTGFEECSMIDESHHAVDRAWEEYEHICEVLDLENACHKHTEVAEDVKYDAMIDRVVTMAEERNKESETSIAEQLKGIRANRSMDKEKNREKENAFAQEVAHVDSSPEVYITSVEESGLEPQVTVEVVETKLNPRTAALLKAHQSRKYKK